VRQQVESAWNEVKPLSKTISASVNQRPFDPFFGGMPTRNLDELASYLREYAIEQSNEHDQLSLWQGQLHLYTNLAIRKVLLNGKAVRPATVLSRRTRQRIEDAVYIAINQKSDLQLGWKVLKSAAVTAEVIRAITNFVNETKISISGRTFYSEKYTDPKGTRLFTLLPVYSFTLGISISMVEFWESCL
jgi:hypothetical protein